MKSANTRQKLNPEIEVVLGQMTDGLVEVSVTVNGTTFTEHLPLNGGKLTVPLAGLAPQSSPLSIASVLASTKDAKAQQRQHTKNDVDRKRKQLMKKRDRDGLR